MSAYRGQMGTWPKLKPNAPGELVNTSGSEWLPAASALPVHYEGDAYLPRALPATADAGSLIAAAWPDVEAANNALVSLDGTAENLPNPHLLANPFRIREAQASSRIENTIASAEEVALAELGESRSDDSVEVRYYITALEGGLRSEQTLAQPLLRSMHQALLSGGARGADKRPGDYRIGQAYIEGDRKGFSHARFVPPPTEHVQSCMDQLDAFLTQESPAFPRIMQAALVHYQFETIHPFADGNGRLGRMLIILQLCRSGLLRRPLIDISSFLDAHRDTYFDLLLDVSLEGNWLTWIQFFCRGVAHQAREARLRVRVLLDLRREYIDLVTEPRASALLRELVDWLFSRPAIKTVQVASHLGIRHQAAQRHVDRLVEKGILREITGGNYDRTYLAHGIINAIERVVEPPPGDPP